MSCSTPPSRTLLESPPGGRRRQRFGGLPHQVVVELVLVLEHGTRARSARGWSRSRSSLNGSPQKLGELGGRSARRLRSSTHRDSSSTCSPVCAGPTNSTRCDQ